MSDKGDLVNNLGQPKDKHAEQELKKLRIEVGTCRQKLLKLEWNIRVRAEFSNSYKKDMIEIHRIIMNFILDMLRSGNLKAEEMRIHQIEFLRLAKKAHKEILNNR